MLGVVGRFFMRCWLYQRATSVAQRQSTCPSRTHIITSVYGSPNSGSEQWGYHCRRDAIRHREEFDAPILELDAQKHLFGAASLTRLQEKFGPGSRLRQAAYWACLRQELYVALRG